MKAANAVKNMEVDLHHLPFRTLRSLSSKRPRSPDSCLVDRPQKRLSLAVANGDHAVSFLCPATRFYHHHHHHTPQSSASFVDEDMVLDPNEVSEQSEPHPRSGPPQTASEARVIIPCPMPLSGTLSSATVLQANGLLETRPPSPVDMPSMAMAISPASSVIARAAAPTRQRFTMGPRADCSKCQQGLKGHSVHY